MNSKILPQISNIVVLMMENRSFDNLIGWLYDKDNAPKNFIIPPDSQPRHFNGLAFGDYSNPLNNDKNIFPITKGTDHYRVPEPDPDHSFQSTTKQFYRNISPKSGDIAPMSGFIEEYMKLKGSKPGQIMQTYSPEQLPVHHILAKQFAVSDYWFSSVPTQTIPNRAFMHCGSSAGNVNNFDGFTMKKKTIFEVMDEQDINWSVYSDNAFFPSFVKLQFPIFWHHKYKENFLDFQNFINDATNGDLPKYSFIEPMFIFTDKLSLHKNRANSMHPPLSTLSGDKFLKTVYDAIFSGPHRDNTALIITYDEHGGAYDHVSPPWGASTPDQESNPGKHNFYFDRFGGRVPTIVVSPWVPESTVFRSFGTPYDQTSILATIIDWLGLPRDVLNSKRVEAAENISSIFTLEKPREISKTLDIDHSSLTDNIHSNYHEKEPSDLERALLGAYMCHKNNHHDEGEKGKHVHNLVKKNHTLGALIEEVLHK